MKIVELNKFLDIFAKKKQQTMTEFIEEAKVKVGKTTTPLKEYMKKKNIHKSDIKILFENIQDRNEYLTRFYNLSLQVTPENTHITDKPMKSTEMNNNINIKYKNIIRNIHYQDILEKTKSGIENVPTFFSVLKDLYLHSIIDYKLLTPSGLHYIREGRIGSVFSSYYFRASIMNPYFVYSLNQSIFKATKIFTPTLGWSSYSFGFLESHYIKEYVGVDVIPSVCKKTAELIECFPKKIKYEIICQPSEDLLKIKRFADTYRNHFDLVFFSPPYYELELYDSANQSTTRYKTYEEWLTGYWEKTIQLCHHVVEKGGKLCYVLSGYGSDKQEYDLLHDMNEITKKYFQLKSQQPMLNKDVHVTKHKETNERIMIFTKK